MSQLLYNLFIKIYVISLNIAALFNPKAKKWIDGRRTVFQLLEQEKFNNPIWFHCASVGEFEQGYPLLSKLQEKNKESDFIITFFSPSGYEFIQKKYPELKIFYLPIDGKRNAEKFIEIVQPSAAYFIKYEFWLYYLKTLHTKQIPTFLVSGIFRNEQIFFTWYGGLHRQMLSYFSYLFVQTHESKKLLNEIGITHCGVFGDTRTDRVLALKKTILEFDIINEFCGDCKVFIAGSVWQTDHNILQKIIEKLPSNWKIILVPHEPDHYDASEFGKDITLYTHYTGPNHKILVVDTIGKLAFLYRKAHLAYIGGGYGKGIHNMLEAIVYNIPVLIGPKFKKFNEAVELINLGAAFCTESTDFEKTMDKLLKNKEFYNSVCEKSAKYISANTNVSERIMVFLETHKPFENT
ncbi:MAG: 3-deoxy-D-manno-octulosonic acid transferase [Bacteroidetes bacterium]|nr:3-deoxy-D-manno-octulosonic acid transferase [Bacteroidota bacterium]